MRSDFYSLPWAAQQAIRKGERAAREADAEARTVAELKAEVERLEAEKRMLEHLLCEAREVVRKTGGGDAILNDIDAALEPSKPTNV